MNLRNLCILFVEDIPKKLCYPIFELILDDKNGYYKINTAHKEVKERPFDFFLQNPRNFCYIITMENQLLMHKYPEKVNVFLPVVEGLYMPLDCQYKGANKQKTLQTKMRKFDQK